MVKRESLDKKKKAVVCITCVATVVALCFLISHFSTPSSPLGKWIYAQFVCAQSGLPIVDLPITIDATTIKTNATGWVVFGSGYPPGTYTLEWDWWDGYHSDTVTIDCTQRDWYYDYELPNPVVQKTFLVATHTPMPAEGVEVTLVGYGAKTTDVAGYVEWFVDYPFVDTELTWTWNSIPASEDVLWADFVGGVWEKTNSLEPKSGGGIQTTLG